MLNTLNTLAFFFQFLRFFFLLGVGGIERDFPYGGVSHTRFTIYVIFI